MADPRDACVAPRRAIYEGPPKRWALPFQLPEDLLHPAGATIRRMRRIRMPIHQKNIRKKPVISQVLSAHPWNIRLPPHVPGGTGRVIQCTRTRYSREGAMHNMLPDDACGAYGPAGKIPVKIGTRIRLIDPVNIVYAKSCGDYVDISLASGEILHTKEQITRLESRLPASLFARVHRSYVVNVACIREIRRRQNAYELELTGDRRIAASSSYRRQIRERILPGPKRMPAAAAMEQAREGDGSVQEIRSPEETGGPGDGLQMRACGPGDEHRLALIGQATFMETFAEHHNIEDILAHCASLHSPAFYRRWLEDADVRIWVLEKGASKTPVGYMAVTSADLSVPDCGDDDLVLQRIYLKEGWYDRCIRSRLFANAIRYAQELGCKRLWAWDFVKNRKILEFYASVGFRPRSQYLYRVGSSEYQEVALSLEL